MSTGMSGQNGNAFEMGKMWGELTQHMRRTEIILDRQTGVLEDTRDMLRHLLTTSHGSQQSPSATKELGTTLQDLTFLVKALYPVLLLLAAVGKKVIFPEAAPLLQEAVSLMSAIVSGGKS
jgi:hypothetical protein